MQIEICFPNGIIPQMCVLDYGELICFAVCLGCVYGMSLFVIMVWLPILHSVHAVFMISDGVAQIQAAEGL